MIRRALGLAAGAIALGAVLLGAPGRPVAFDSGRAAFAYIYQVATHPRCLNCHGEGKGAAARPLVGDAMQPHPMNITIAHNPGQRLGLECGTCHGDRNLPDRATPPGFSNTRMPFPWHMPADDTMRVWPILASAQPEGEKQAALCRVWHRFLTRKGEHEFRHHIADDPLIEWALTRTSAREPAGDRQRLGQAVDAWMRWLAGGGSCDELAR